MYTSSKPNYNVLEKQKQSSMLNFSSTEANCEKLSTSKLNEQEAVQSESGSGKEIAVSIVYVMTSPSTSILACM